MSELLPCPFCGGEAVGFEWSDDKYRDDETEPHDQDEYCSVKVNHKKDCILEVGEFYLWIASTEAEAAELWNTRAERTCKVVDYNRYMFSYSVYLSCGHEISEINYFPRYCPKCGAKVEVMHDANV